MNGLGFSLQSVDCMTKSFLFQHSVLTLNDSPLEAFGITLVLPRSVYMPSLLEDCCRGRALLLHTSNLIE